MDSARAHLPAESHASALPGMAAGASHASVQVASEPPEASARALYVAARALAAAATFLFLGFLFAFFYLRSLDEGHMWHPAAVKPDRPLGTVVLVCTVASALLGVLAARHMKKQLARWAAAAIPSLLLGLGAVAAQCVQYTHQHFGPTGGGYASVFYGWTALYALTVLGAMYWLQTQIASGLRARRKPASAQGGIADPDALIAPGLDAAVFFWSCLAVLGVVMWVTLYLI